jgi:quaternary ammonium compound-resistance protein SugE
VSAWLALFAAGLLEIAWAFGLKYSDAGSIIVGMLIYSEPADPVRVLCLTLIVAGVLGLKLNSPV